LPKPKKLVKAAIPSLLALLLRPVPFIYILRFIF